jgi:NAD(P)-dependent dehydrogenase (short-subunit alcohol dehydrogenase family)
VQPFIGMGAYRMSKVALTYLSTDLAMELEPDGIAVNGFDPGPVVSDGTAAIRKERQDRYGVAIAYHELDPVDVLDAPILWLAQQTAASFTGHVVRRIEFGQAWGPSAANESAVNAAK